MELNFVVMFVSVNACGCMRALEVTLNHKRCRSVQQHHLFTPLSDGQVTAIANYARVGTW